MVFGKDQGQDGIWQRSRSGWYLAKVKVRMIFGKGQGQGLNNE